MNMFCSSIPRSDFSHGVGFGIRWSGIALLVILCGLPLASQNPALGPFYPFYVGPTTTSAGSFTIEASFLSGGGEGRLTGTEYVFATNASLVANDPATTSASLQPPYTHGKIDIYARDFQAGTTELISANGSGQGGNDHSTKPHCSAGGRYVVFETEATDIVTPDTNGFKDIILVDRQTGLKEKCSLGVGGVEANDESFDPRVSDDGRYVVFISKATNLVPNDTNGKWDAFLRDRLLGTTTRVGMPPSGGEPNGHAILVRISGDGSCIALWSTSSNLSPMDTDIFADLYTVDVATGQIVFVSYDIPGYFNGQTVYGDISADGSVLIHDAISNGGIIITEMPSLVQQFVPFPTSGLELSANGRYVVAYGYAPGIPYPNNYSDAIRFDRITMEFTRASSPPDAGPLLGQGSGAPAISEDGRYVAFVSLATNILPAPTFPPLSICLTTLSCPIGIIADMGPGESIGSGTPGSLVIPTQTRAVQAFNSSSGSLSLLYAPANAPCFLGLKVAPPGPGTPMFGGTVHPWPPDVIGTYTFPGGLGGTSWGQPLVLPYQWAGSTIPGTPVQVQWAIVDPAAPGGVALSNAYLATRP